MLFFFASCSACLSIHVYILHIIDCFFGIQHDEMLYLNQLSIQIYALSKFIFDKTQNLTALVDPISEGFVNYFS